MNGLEFHWRFKSLIEIRPTQRKDNKLIIDFEWLDPWLLINDKSGQQSNLEPKIVTPVFVREGIEFALGHHWDVDKKTGIEKVLYRNNQFISAS